MLEKINVLMFTSAQLKEMVPSQHQQHLAEQAIPDRYVL